MTKYKLVPVHDVNRMLKKGWFPFNELDCVVDSATGATYVWIYKAKRRA